MQSLWTVIGGLLFSLMALCIKSVAHDLNAAEILFYRCLVSLAVIGAYASLRGLSVTTPHWKAHFRRSLCGTFSMSVWYFTLGALPMATSVTLNYMSPIFIAILVIVQSRGDRRETNGSQMIPVMFVLLGFVGAIVLLRPTVSTGEAWVALLGVFAAFVAAFAFQDIRRLAQLNEPEWLMVFHFSLWPAIFSFVTACLWGFHTLTLHDAIFLTTASTLGMLGQLAVSRAYGKGKSLLSASLQYSGILFSVIWGAIFAGENIDVTTWTGIAIIVVSGVGSTIMSTQVPPTRAATSHMSPLHNTALEKGN
jgi:S-adenosylmethionine uptake transporter